MNNLGRVFDRAASGSSADDFDAIRIGIHNFSFLCLLCLPNHFPYQISLHPCAHVIQHCREPSRDVPSPQIQDLRPFL